VITGMHHVAISVSDIDRSIAFYTEALGMELTVAPFTLAQPDLEEIMDTEQLDGRMCLVSGGGVTLELFEFVSPRPAPPADPFISRRGFTHFGFTVDDIEAEHARLSARGVKFLSRIMTFQPTYRAVYGKDPDGNVFELLQPLETA
jgi:catechol 2,3-dioxygenase-like lactoylglutathione lyase family enzyme